MLDLLIMFYLVKKFSPIFSYLYLFFSLQSKYFFSYTF
jgi:hypothetical protein